MSELISRKKLIESIKKFDFGSFFNDTEKEYIESTMISLVNLQPTEYDVEKVVEKLNELEVKENTRYKNGDFGDFDGVDYYIKKSDAIEIVKQSGVSNDVCEWIIDEKNIYSPHKPFILSLSDKDCWNEFCPICKKKIKVVE